MSESSLAILRKLTLLHQTDSTNDVLLQMPAAERHAHAVLADQQLAGRGRRGRRWQSPAGRNIYLSLGWNFRMQMEELACLPLAVGVAVVQGLERCGLSGLGLKWPNDILASGKKLGGILLESKTSAPGMISVVAGMGLNVAMAGSAEAEAIDQPWVSITELMGSSPDIMAEVGLRDRLTGHILSQVLSVISQFEQRGFEASQSGWQRLDLLRGRQISVRTGNQVLLGESLGIDSQGKLLLQETLPDGRQNVKALDAGEVSVRLCHS